MEQFLSQFVGFFEGIGLLFVSNGEIGLLAYSFLKAFLPMLSVEVVQIPLTLITPDKWVAFALLTIVGTIVGSALGYFLGMKLGTPILRKIAKPSTIKMGHRMLDQYGVVAVGIGSLLPIPDFLVIYLAGMVRMNFWKFMVVNAVARSLRSFLFGYGTFVFGAEMSKHMNVDAILLYIIGPIILIYIGYKLWSNRREKRRALAEEQKEAEANELDS
ncbi:MAG: YqaA family protein [Christensenellales bacterium]|jgi:membrane protein DedA with SNARE-associated domain